MTSIAIKLFILLLILFSSFSLSILINKQKNNGYVLILAIIYSLFQIQFTTLLLGTLKLLKPNLLLLVNVVISICILFFIFKSQYFKSIILRIKEIHIKNILIRGIGIPAIFFLSIFIINSATIAYRILVLPPAVWDVNTYHLISPINWYQTESIPKLINTPVDRANSYFMGTKIFNYWSIMLTDSLALVESTQFLFTFLLLTTVFLIMRLIKIPKNTAITFSVLAISFPTILIQMRTVHDHTVLLSLNFVLLYLVMDLIKFKKSLSLTDFLNIFIVAMLTIAVKINGIIYIVLGVIVYLFIIKPSLKTAILKVRQILSVHIKPIKLILTIFVIIASLFIGTYWGIKNYRVYHNFLGSSQYLQLETTEEKSNLISYFKLAQKFYDNFKIIPNRIFDVSADYSPDSTKISSYGFQFISIGALAYIISIIFLISHIKLDEDTNVNKAILFMMAFGLINQLALYAVYFSVFNYRLFTIFPIIGIILASKLWAIVKPNNSQKLIFYILITCILSFTYFVLPTVETTNSQKFSYAFSRKLIINTADYFAHSDDEWMLINLLPENKTIVYFTPEDGFVLPYYDQKLKTKVISLSEFEYSIDNNVLIFPMSTIIKMKDRGVDYLHIYKKSQKINSSYFELMLGGLYKFTYEQ